MEKLRNSLQRVLRWEAVHSDISPEALSGEVRKDGSLAGVDYRLTWRSGWQPERHLSVMSMLAASQPETAARMLDFWVKTDSISENWWWPRIGTPLRICKTMILLGRKAEKDDPVRAILDRSTMGSEMTGQNKVWLAEIHLMKGLLYGDPEMVRTGRELILSEIRISREEGLQPDWSYHQHGAQLQSGNYGLSWFHDMALWAAAFAGTEYALPPDRLELIVQFYLRGLHWTLTGKIMDISACGRQIVPPYPENKFRQIRRTAALLRENGCLEEPDGPPDGSVCYPCSGYLIHRCGDFFFSVKMCSARLKGSESCNSENIQGFYAGDGATMLYPGFRWDPAELALRDWRKVPGTTELEKPAPVFVKGVPSHNSEGDYCCWAENHTAAAMMRFRNAELQADKAWFCFGRYIVCMGGAIRALVPDKPVTTIVQAFRTGPVRLDGKPLPDGETESDGRTSFTFDGMKYLLPENGRFHFLADRRTGNWNTVNLEYPSTPVSGPMLTVRQEHGPGADGYLYVIHPENAPSPELEYLRGEGILGIRSREGVMIAFFKPGKILDIEMKEPVLYLDFGGIRKIVHPDRETGE